MEYKIWKWSKGEKIIRSPRNIDYERNNDYNKNSTIFDVEYLKEIENTAYQNALNHNEDTWDILNQIQSNNNFRQSNQREELVSKIANREMIHQIGANPFMNNTSYVNDIDISSTFLKPVNTSQDKITVANECE